MSMHKEQIEAAIEDRLTVRWKKRCLDEMAAPVCVIAIKQLPGKDFGRTVVCTLEDMKDEELATLMAGVAHELMRRK
jgi:hypothetical protein